MLPNISYLLLGALLYYNALLTVTIADSLHYSGLSLRGSQSSAQSRGRAPLPRYLMPTNSYQKKVNTDVSPQQRRSSAQASRRSRSPTMITNSNSKHVNNVYSAGRGGDSGGGGSGGNSPTLAYTIKRALSRSSTPNDRTAQALAGLQGPPKPSAQPTQPSQLQQQQVRCRSNCMYMLLDFPALISAVHFGCRCGPATSTSNTVTQFW
jgi:hypothetical protein